MEFTFSPTVVSNTGPGTEKKTRVLEHTKMQGKVRGVIDLL